MINVLSDLTSKRMLTLTKAGLHETNPDENLFVNMGESDWNELFEQLALQGVMVLSFIGAMRLPKELHPPLALKMRWIASKEAVEKRYRHQLETAKELSFFFKENNIRMLLFKGIALSRLYPVPSSREFGDIDIFLCGKSKEGDALMNRITGEKSVTSKKHVNFSYRGILIENHHTFLNQNRYTGFFRNDFLEKRLMMMLTEAGIFSETDSAESGQTDEILLFPPPEFDALFITLHTLTHLSNRIVLRHLCDLTVLFTVYREKIDFYSYRNTLSEAGLLKFADILISLAVRYLDLNPMYAPPYESDLLLENRFWNDLLYPAVSSLPKDKRTLINVFIHKIKLLRMRYWKNKLVFPGKFWAKILFSIFFHFRYPKTIGKI